MASTRSRNTPGDYCVEQRSYQQQSSYTTDRNYAFATPTLLAGDGLLAGQVPDTELSGNPKDIESFLFGIGASNLVAPQTPVNPELKFIPSLSIMNKPQLFMPADLIIQNDQRQYPMK